MTDYTDVLKMQLDSSSDEDDDISEKLNIMNVGSKRKPKVDYKA